MALSDLLISTIAPTYIRFRFLQERIQSGVVWNLLDPSFIADPYPTYRALRERDPYHYSPLTSMITVVHYDDVDAILRDHRRFSSVIRGTEPFPVAEEQARRQLSPSMQFRDPPDHTRLRGLVNRAFTPPQIAKMEDQIRATAHSLLDEVADSNDFDLMANFANLLPMLVIAEMIGVPTEDRDQFKAWSDQIIRGLEPNLSDAELSELLDNAEALAEYFAPIIEDRRREPRDDLVSRLVIAEEAGQTLSHDETQITLRLLLVAGNETTTNLIGNGLKVLIERFDEIGFGSRESEYRRNVVLRGLEHLDVRVQHRNGRG